MRNNYYILQKNTHQNYWFSIGTYYKTEAKAEKMALWYAQGIRHKGQEIRVSVSRYSLIEPGSKEAIEMQF